MIILQTAGVGTTLGRAVNTFKLNIKPAAQIMLIPLVVAALEGVVAAIPAAIQSLTIPAAGMVAVSILSTILIFILSIISVFITVLFSAPIIRINYSTIVRSQPISLSRSVSEYKKRLGALIPLTIYALITMMIFGAVDIVLGIVGMFGITALLVATSTMATFLGGNSTAAMPFAIAILVITGAVMMVLGLAIISFQMMVSFLPLVYASLDNKRRTFGKTVSHAFRMLFANLPRAIVFGMLLIIFWTVLAAVLQLPVGVWMGFELRRFDSTIQPGTLPLHVSFVVNLITSIVKTVMTPFGLCALAFFWYDCQVRKEGADLSQWLARMHRETEAEADAPASHHAA